MIGGRARILLSATILLPHVVRAQPIAGVEPLSELSGIVLSLVIVIGVILVGAWAVRRSPLGAGTRRAGPLRVVATLPLGPKERLVLVEVEGCELLVGVSPAGISPIHRNTERGSAPTAVMAPTAERLEPSSFRDTLDLTGEQRIGSHPR